VPQATTQSSTIRAAAAGSSRIADRELIFGFEQV
jgi:hypothetical protein